MQERIKGSRDQGSLFDLFFLRFTQNKRLRCRSITCCVGPPGLRHCHTKSVGQRNGSGDGAPGGSCWHHARLVFVFARQCRLVGKACESHTCPEPKADFAGCKAPFSWQPSSSNGVKKARPTSKQASSASARATFAQCLLHLHRTRRCPGYRHVATACLGGCKTKGTTD